MRRSARGQALIRLIFGLLLLLAVALAVILVLSATLWRVLP